MSKHKDSTLYEYDADSAPTDERTITIVHVSEDHDVYGGRAKRGACMGETAPPYTGWLGNPYRVADHGRMECIRLFEQSFLVHLRQDRDFCNAVVGLPNRRVACHCRRADENEPPCHLDVVRRSLLDGTVFRIAITLHDIAVPEWMVEAACDPEELL